MPSESKEELIKIKAYHVVTLFPRAPKVLGVDENQYGIAKFEVIDSLQGNVITDKNGLITIKGTFVERINKGEVYTILAKRDDDPQWGIQYTVLYIAQQIDFTKFKNLNGFLRTFLTEGQIEEFYKLYDNPLEVIASHDMKKILAVHGVGPYIANCIIERYEENVDKTPIYIELDSYGLTPNFIQRLIQTYITPNAVIQAVKSNPYQLIDDVDGVGFTTADEIALKGGLNPKSPDRIAAYIEYFLKEQAVDGNSYVNAGLLLQQIYSHFGSKELIQEDIFNDEGELIGSNISLAIKSLQDKDIIKVEENENKLNRRVYLTKIWELENDIAYHLKRLLNAPNNFYYKDWEDKVAQLEDKQGFKFDDTQKQGIKLGLDKQVCFISGLGGTGKSSLVSGILAALNRYTFAQCALSGKASARLQEVTGAEGSTIHRLLGFMPGFGFEYNEDNKLPYDIIILDEISLVGGDIFLSLLKAIPDGSKLIMLGDLGQLTSIGVLNLASDLFYSPVIPNVNLTTIHRQAAKSGIITASHSVRNQEQLFEDGFEGQDVIGELKDMTIDIEIERDNIRSKCLDWFKYWYTSDLVQQDISKIQLIAPVKERGDACVYNLNIDIQQFYNPYIEGDPCITVGYKDHTYHIQEKDKVMCIKNNYKAINSSGTYSPIYNGWVGVVEEITDKGLNIYFPLAKDTIFVPLKMAKTSIVLGYASTVHKLQGSDYPVIIGAIDYATPPKMLDNALVYTLITRAKKQCVLIAQNRALRKAIATDFVAQKHTFLQELLLKGDSNE